jgi:hypothetical protein
MNRMHVGAIVVLVTIVSGASGFGLGSHFGAAARLASEEALRLHALTIAHGVSSSVMALELSEQGDEVSARAILASEVKAGLVQLKAIDSDYPSNGDAASMMKQAITEGTRYVSKHGRGT